MLNEDNGVGRFFLDREELMSSKSPVDFKMCCGTVNS
jgi:hypothetical protein